MIIDSAVWKSEGKINTNLFPDGKWWDELDDRKDGIEIQIRTFEEITV
jgi:hypothetical protein